MSEKNYDLDVIICIPTFKRRENLQALLASLELQTLAAERQVRWGVALIDNDPEESAKPVFDEFLARGKLDIKYEPEKRSGLSYVRNKAIETGITNADLMCFLDDDQTVVPTWLDEMLRVQRATHAGCVSGQVIAVLPPETPQWVHKSNFFERNIVADEEVMPLTSTANLMFDCNFLRDSGLRFDHRFRHTGGEDTYFFTLAVGEHHLKIVSAEHAIAHEYTFLNRVTLSWFMKRAFRAGGTLVQCERLYKPSLSRNILRCAKIAASVAKGLVMIPAGIILGRHISVLGLTALSLAAGELAGEFGYVFKEYGALHEKKEP